MSIRIWMTTLQAAEHVGRHEQTVRKAAEDKQLHGTQRKKGGRWRFHVSCVDAWVLGDECVHLRKKAS